LKFLKVKNFVRTFKEKGKLFSTVIYMVIQEIKMYSFMEITTLKIQNQQDFFLS